eukprot:scaffold22100_cov29-Attheya_sp.AAC.2
MRNQMLEVHGKYPHIDPNWTTFPTTDPTSAPIGVTSHEPSGGPRTTVSQFPNLSKCVSQQRVNLMLSQLLFPQICQVRFLQHMS